jgi:hypothetical protein
MMVLGISAIHPGHASINLFCIGINAGAFDTSYDSLITVLYTWGDFGLLVEAQIRE